jgi:prevent-host-death family protein
MSRHNDQVMSARKAATSRVSKSEFKPKALEYFRRIEATGEELIITERGRPVIRIVPYEHNSDEDLRSLRDTVLAYSEPTEPVATEDWEALR